MKFFEQIKIGDEICHLDPPANGQAVIFLTGLLEVFISEISLLATVSDTSEICTMHQYQRIYLPLMKGVNKRNE